MQSAIKNDIKKTKREPAKRIDYIMLITVILLVIIGVLMIFSASSVQASYEYNDSTKFLRSQLQFAAIGFVFMYIASKVNYKIYKDYVFIIYIFNIILLILTLSPLGVSVAGAKRWLNVGFRFQTSEFSKFACIVTTAYFINLNKYTMHKLKSVIIPIGFLILNCALIYVQPSFSAMSIILMVGLIMIFVGGMSVKFMLISAVPFGVGIITLMMKQQYRMARLISFLDPFKDTSGRDWQISNSIYAMASGGLFGVGFGKSTQKYFYISQPQNDFIFAVIAEEFGFLMSVLLIFIYVFLIFRIFRLFVDTKDTFGKMIVCGVGLQLGLQTIMNIGVATSTLPNTGIGLPFISYGGTSIIMFLSMTGVLLNISRYRVSKRKKEVVK
ncbi:putative cell division protein FtsW [Peptoanaerobacter stomatis]|uniref:Probable peptidoglycan glycosyltransferase FtsW n=1 Tax=Peptoanaerobacter stomatis TaxID=796937 RepID=J5UFV1_9FIRM|nr:putative peptidoglycan glycosyltransferase FtsW [Peptoanaerobacter stomatis]EJU22199.1 putative cell division protein FtsW [Peptoanaerobacter stomatis]NWO24889.1 cell division protein FtsW [Peptostreptococcaceae bacterium oral taxon 081]